jgi:hypothetical protein
MNGLLTFNDGAGTVIENGTITTQSLSLNNILATITNTSVSLWNNFMTGSVYLMTNMAGGSVYLATGLSAGNAGVLYLGNELCSIVLGIFNIVGASIQLGLGSTVDLFTDLTSGTITVGNATVSLVLGSFTFLGTSIQAGTLGTFNFFTNVTGSSTVNLFSNMPSGTFNIGKGGNINLGQATTGSLIKIDQNGLDTQVIIAPQQNATGTVLIGSNANTNRIGNLNIVNNTVNPNTTGQTINIGTSNVTTANFATSATTANFATSATTTNINTTSGNTFIGSNTGTTRMSGAQNMIYNTTATRPAYLEMYSVPSNVAYSDNFLDFHVGGGGANVNYDARINVTAFNTTAEGRGNIIHNCGQSEFLYPVGIAPLNRGTNYGIGFGYVNGIDNGSYIAGYQPWGAVVFGGCGNANPIASTNYVQSMAIYPYYGLRLYTGGISFDKGNLTSGYGSGRGSFIQTGTYTSSTTIAGGNTLTIPITFPSAFGNIPVVTATANVNGGAGNFLSCTVAVTVVGSMTIYAKNDTGLSTSGLAWGINWIAIGSY